MSQTGDPISPPNGVSRLPVFGLAVLFPRSEIPLTKPVSANKEMVESASVLEFPPVGVCSGVLVEGGVFDLLVQLTKSKKQMAVIHLLLINSFFINQRLAINKQV